MKYQEVLSHLAKPGERLRPHYLYALSRMTPAQLELFRRQWPTVDRARRRAVIQGLAELTENSFEVNFDPVFLLAMGDEDDEVRAAAIEGLWENESPSLIRPLIQLLRADTSEIVRAAAAVALGRFVLLSELEKLDRATGDRVEEALREAIRRPSETVDVRQRAIESIAYSGKDDVRQIIKAAYHSPDEKLQASALFGMGRSADSHWRRIVTFELDNPNPELRYEAARACGELELSQAIPRLGEMVFDDPDREVQEVAVWALGCIGGREARAVLEACYEGDDEFLKQAATEALDQMDMLDEDLAISLYEDGTDDELDDEEELDLDEEEF